MSKSKIRRGIAIALSLFMVVSGFFAVFSVPFKTWQFLLMLLISAGLGLLIAANFKIPKILSGLLLLLFPLGALCCMEFFTHVPWDLTNMILLLNYLFFLFVYLICTALAGGTRWGCVIAPGFFALAGTINYFVVNFRSSPVVPWDFFSIGTAASVAGNYGIKMEWRLYLVLSGFFLLMILGEKMTISLKDIRIRLVSIGVSGALVAGFVGYVQTDQCQKTFALDTTLFTPNVLYRNNGFMAAFFANLQYLHIEKPKNYSVNTAQEIANDTLQTEAAYAEERPNILVIMNEAFSDLSVYGDFRTTEDYMPFFNSLYDNTVRGNLFVSVKGGNTANSEFEFLTGNSMAFLPTGSVPYQQFLNGEMPSLASQLADMGYLTAALHPYYASGWNRDKVYEYLGFHNQYFYDTGDFPDATKLRGWVDDRSSFQKLIQLYEEKEPGTPLFAFEVTMQNHGGYSKEYEDLTNEIKFMDLPDSIRSVHRLQIESTEKYLTLLKKTDEAFEELISYFSAQDEKTIILMFGDHQPSEYITNSVLRLLGEDTTTRNDMLERMATSFEVPYLIWANYDIQEKETDAISANYLSTLLLETAGLPLNDYQCWLGTLAEEYPVVTANFYKDSSGNIYQWEEEKPETLQDYAVLQYNNLVDDKHRISGFFEAE